VLAELAVARQTTAFARADVTTAAAPVRRTITPTPRAAQRADFVDERPLLGATKTLEQERYVLAGSRPTSSMNPRARYGRCANQSSRACRSRSRGGRNPCSSTFATLCLFQTNTRSGTKRSRRS
jgi:hypothetical protein